MASKASKAAGPEVTDEANPGPVGSTTCGTQVGEYVVVVAVCNVRALRTARFRYASVMRLILPTLAPLVILLRQGGRSRARVSHVLLSTPSVLRHALRQSL